jgi:hypothetical protein
MAVIAKSASKKRRSLRYLALFVPASILALYLPVLLPAKGPYIAARTKVECQAIAMACQQFHTTTKRWPTNLSELQTNQIGLIFFTGRTSDFWKRPYIYNRPVDCAPGKIETYGSDGKPDGNQTDGDFSFSFVPR